tara:strand:- start:1101 stop:1580 length:480 start_codon:yes stop_codon:yes gene_type:complete
MKSQLWIVGILATLLACNQNSKQENNNGNNSETVIANDTIPETRSEVTKQAVASYSEKVPDPLNDWKFAVNAHETDQTFTYLLKIQYKALDVTDTLTIPNFGIYPTIELKKGPTDFSCIVGFLDKENTFKDYKIVEVVSGQLKIRTLKSYRRGLYQVKK